MSTIGPIAPSAVPPLDEDAATGCASASAPTVAGSPAVVRGGAPVRPVIHAAPPEEALPAGARAPVPEAVYGPIFAEIAGAEWEGCGIDPERYVADRLDMEHFIGPLLADPDAKVVLHRDALKIGQVGSIDGSRTFNVAHPRAKDYPGRVYYAREDGCYHLVGIPGEDWVRQSLFMLAVAGVPRDKIELEGVSRAPELIAADLDEVLSGHDFDSVTIGTMGELTRAVERVLRRRGLPAHTAKVIGQMEAHLEERVRTSRPDKQPRWEARLGRLRELRAAGGPALEQLARIEDDPVLRGPLGELIREAKDGPPRDELPMRYRTRGGDLLAHRVLEVDGRKHLLIHIGGAHGDLAHATIRHILEREPALGQVNVYGSAGSFREDIPPDTFLLPQTFRSHEEGRPELAATNGAALEGAVEVTHTNVSTLLREHRGGLARMSEGTDTVDMESYHVARAVSEAGRPVALNAILRVSDVATSAELGAHREDRDETSDYDARREGEERVVVALGLVRAEEL